MNYTALCKYYQAYTRIKTWVGFTTNAMNGTGLAVAKYRKIRWLKIYRINYHTNV